MDIVSVVDEGLGHSSSLVDLGDGTAAVIDPARFPNRQRRLAAERGWQIAWTADTHSHADYISGSPELATDGATFLASAGAHLEIEHRAISPGDELDLSDDVSLRAIATPGHTPDHLAILVVERGVPAALFSGGSLMVGTVGRTDLLGDDRREELARALFRSLRTEILTLADELAVYPTHGAGSFCSAPGSSERTTTIGRERRTNPLLQIGDEDDFVAELLAGFDSFPPYFRTLPERNRRGPDVYPAVPKLAPLDPEHVERLMAAGAVLVDTRPVAEFGAAHPAGAISIAARPGFASWLGWLVESDRPVVFLVGDDDVDRDELVTEAMRVGHDHLLGEVAGGMVGWRTAGLPVSSIPVVRAHDTVGTVIDVRQRSEWERGHVSGSRHIELGAVTSSDVGDGPVTTMCGHGERAMTAASLLAASGRRDVAVLAGGPEDVATATGQPLATGR